MPYCILTFQQAGSSSVLDVKEGTDWCREFFGAPPDVFEFGSPTSDFFGRHAFGGGGGVFGGVFGAGFSSSRDTHVEAPLTLTLEELYTGGQKRLAINRRIYDAASGSGVRVREEVMVSIMPGWQEGQRCAAPAGFCSTEERWCKHLLDIRIVCAICLSERRKITQAGKGEGPADHSKSPQLS